MFIKKTRLLAELFERFICNNQSPSAHTEFNNDRNNNVCHTLHVAIVLLLHFVRKAPFLHILVCTYTERDTPN